MDDEDRRDTGSEMMDMTMSTRQQLEKEVRDLHDKIDRVQDLDVIVTMSDDGTRVTEVDPQDSLPDNPA